MISVETATDIAMAYREIATAEKLLADVEQQIEKSKFGEIDLRDSFGRSVYGLQLGVPSGDTSQRIFNVDWRLAKPILQAHIAQTKAKLTALNEKAIAEQNLVEGEI